MSLPSFQLASPFEVPIQSVVIDGNGIFSWTPTAEDVGKYVVSFYDSASRTKDPRRTLVTVQSGLSESDPLFFLSGLKGYWRLGENTGNTFVDASGNAHDLTVPSATQSYLTLGTPGHRPGQKALYFKNTNPAKFSTFSFSNLGLILDGFPLAYHPYLLKNTVLARPFTASYWFKADQRPTNNEVILDLGSTVYSGVGPGPASSNNFARVFCSYGFSPDLTVYAGLHPQNIDVTIGEWHHQVFVYDGVSTKIYMDGVRRAEIPCGQIEEFVASRGIYFGGGWGGNNYLGSLSDLALWNRPLAEAEITRLHAVQKLDSTFPSLTRPLPVQNMRIGN